MGMSNSFSIEEGRCNYNFQQLGTCWHLYSPENYEIIFTGETDFKAAMTLLAICVCNFLSIRVLTFQIMNNHLHMVLCGPEEDVFLMFRMFKKYLSLYLKADGRSVSLKEWECKLRRIADLSDARNVIAYNNRNGFLVNNDTSPYSYPWGANRYFFNADIKSRVAEAGNKLTGKSIRTLFHTRELDRFAGLVTLDGYVSPIAFCDIDAAEGLFRNASHYFYAVSKNQEAMRTVASEIGENIFFSDSDLYLAVSTVSRDKYNVHNPSLLPVQAKIEVARMMRFEYNASPKQIARMLKLDLANVTAIVQ